MPILTKIKESLQNPDSKWSKLLKSEALKIGTVVFLGLVLLMFTVPFFFNNSALKFQIEQKASETLGANVTINGDVKVTFLPSLSVIAEDVILQNYMTKDMTYNFYAESVQVKLPFFKFSSNNWIKKIVFSGAMLENYYSLKPPSNRKNSLTERIAEVLKDNPHSENNKSTFDITARLFAVSDLQTPQISYKNAPAFAIKNSRLISYNQFAKKTEIQEISTEAKISEKNIKASGKFTNEEITNNFSINANFASGSSSLEINSSIAKFKIKGSFTSENRDIFQSDFKGTISADILELKSFYKGYIGNNKAIYDKLKAGTSSIQLSADIKNTAGEIEIENLVINSDVVSGKGNIDLDFNSKVTITDINLDLENLDLDKIWSQERVSVERPSDITESNFLDETSEGAKSELHEISPTEEKPDTSAPEESPDLSKKDDTKKAPEKSPIDLNITKNVRNFDLTAEIKVKNIKYLSGEIKDVDLYLTISTEGEVLILPLICTIPGEGNLRVNGVLDNSGDLPKFIGKIDVSGKKLRDIFSWLSIESQNLKFDNLKEYVLYSDIFLLPNLVTLDNLYLNLNNYQSEFLGTIKIDSNGKTTNVLNKFKISSFNVGDYFLTSGQNAYFSHGSLLKKILWLNDIYSDNDLDLKFENLVYNGEEFTNQSVKLGFGQGYFKISDLNLKSNKTDLKANINLDIRDKTPQFEISVVANNFHYDALTDSSKPTFDIKDLLQKKVKGSAADRFFSLPSLEGFDGRVVLSFDHLSVDNNKIENVKFAGNLSDGNIDITTLTCDLYGGNLDYKGLISIKNDKIVNGNVTLTNVYLEEVLPDLVGINNIKGIANISATVTSSAGNSDEFAKNLSSEVKFNANSPTVFGYGLNDLVRKMFTAQAYRDELQTPEKILFNKYSKTTFKKASGSISIKRGKDGNFKFNISAPALNGIASGKINAADNTIDGLVNVIFLTGTRQKQTPINIATSVKGDMSNVSQSSNLDQVKQYLGLRTANPQTSAYQYLGQNPAGQNNEAQKVVTQVPATEFPIQFQNPQAQIPQQIPQGQIPQVQNGTVQNPAGQFQAMPTRIINPVQPPQNLPNSQ